MKHLKSALLASLSLLSCLNLSALAEDSSSKNTEPTYIHTRFRLSDPNPAEFSLYGTGRLQLPSLRVDIGSTISADALTKQIEELRTILPEGSSTSSLSPEKFTALQTQLTSLLKIFENQVRADYEVDINLLGFGGAPISTLQIGDRPLSLGLHVGAETRSFTSAQFSKQFNQSLLTIVGQVPEIGSIASQVGNITSKSGTLGTQVNQLTGNIDNLATRANSFFSNPSQSELNNLTSLLSQVDNDIDALLPTAKELTTVVGATSKSARSLLDILSLGPGEGVKLLSANDLHLTLGLGSSYPVFQSKDIQISVGAQAKVFIVPVNIPASSLNLQSTAGLLGQLELTRISGTKLAEADLAKLTSTLDTFDQAVSSVSKSIDSAEKISAGVDKVENALQQNNLGELASIGPALVSDGLAFNTNLNEAQSNMLKAAGQVTSLQSSLTQQLQNIKAEGKVTTPDGAGFGLDLGIDALLYKNWRVGLVLQNPLVVWQGTETPFEGSLLQTQGTQIDVSPKLTFFDDQAKKVNYNATVPLAVQLSSQYRFDDLLPDFKGLYANGLFEFVNNGRSPALSLGVQKQWGDIGYVGLGGRVGGISPLITFEAGLRPTHGFGLDLQFGMSPTGQGVPFQGLGWLGMSRLGMYVLF